MKNKRQKDKIFRFKRGGAQVAAVRERGWWCARIRLFTRSCLPNTANAPADADH